MDFQELLSAIPQVGLVRWIGVRPEPRAPLLVSSSVTADEVQGLVGDRFDGGASKSRQVTLLQFEHLAVMASILGRDSIDPGLLRRNIVVSGINLQSLKNQYFQIGTAALFGTGDCAPCRRMEENLGPGGHAAMRGHGGITARVHQAGRIEVGDRVALHRVVDSVALSAEHR
jgi:MOSC domain-containing protein YiiM